MQRPVEYTRVFADAAGELLFGNRKSERIARARLVS